MIQYAVTWWKKASDTPPHDTTHIVYDEQEAIRLVDRYTKDGYRVDFKRRTVKLGDWEKLYIVG